MTVGQASRLSHAYGGQVVQEAPAAQGSRDGYPTFGSRDGYPTFLGRGTGSASGVALVVTLILLVVITTLAVAFLALTGRETIAVGSSLSTTDSEQAAAAAAERALAQITASFFKRNTVIPFPAPAAIGSTNYDIMGPDLMVSVARDMYPQVALDRLRVDASPPVNIWTNKLFNVPSAVEYRFYIDLNRNGRFEPTGYVPSTNELNAPILDAGGNLLFEWRVGDPQWIGILRDPTRPHSPSNHFIARYAFIILPAGRTLDVNWIHNQAITNRSAGQDGYFRNQGVGPYELNLPAFLADLDTNYWNNPVTGLTYQYQTNWLPTAAGSSGDAFADAREFLAFRNANKPGRRDRKSVV